MFIQEKYGSNQHFTDYEAFRKCCQTITHNLKNLLYGKCNN